MFTNQLNNPKFVEKAPAKLVEDPRQTGRRPGKDRKDQGEHCGAAGKIATMIASLCEGGGAEGGGGREPY